jgi:hypothetical protein
MTKIFLSADNEGMTASQCNADSSRVLVNGNITLLSSKPDRAYDFSSLRSTEVLPVPQARSHFGAWGLKRERETIARKHMSECSRNVVLWLSLT